MIDHTEEINTQRVRAYNFIYAYRMHMKRTHKLWPMNGLEAHMIQIDQWDYSPNRARFAYGFIRLNNETMRVIQGSYRPVPTARNASEWGSFVTTDLSIVLARDLYKDLRKDAVCQNGWCGTITIPHGDLFRC